jgi:hypothetical protein
MVLYKLNRIIKKKTFFVQALIKKIYFLPFAFQITLYYQQTTNIFSSDDNTVITGKAF